MRDFLGMHYRVVAGSGGRDVLVSCLDSEFRDLEEILHLCNPLSLSVKWD